MLSASRFLAFFRDATWLNGQRVRAYSLILLTLNGLGFLIWVALSHGLIDRAGKPLGADFMSFYAASRLVLDGHASAAWTPLRHHAAETAILHRDLGYWAFFYPPAYLLICTPLALMPYIGALCAWLATTSGAALVLVRRWLHSQQDAPVWLPLLAFPALWINLGNGQNAALTTALFAGGCLLLPRRAGLAGLVFGLLIVKPQLGLALPVLLAASGRWKAFAGMALSAAVISALAWLLVGTDGYLAFLANGRLARATLEQGLVPAGDMVSLFAAVRQIGGHPLLAYVVQTLGAIGVLAVAILYIRRHHPDTPAFCALAAVTSLLMSPFLLDYDLVLSTLPLGWLGLKGLRDGFRPWEKMLILSGVLMPLLARSLATGLHLPIAPLVLLGLFAAITRRIAQPVRQSLMPKSGVHFLETHEAETKV